MSNWSWKRFLTRLFLVFLGTHHAAWCMDSLGALWLGLVNQDYITSDKKWNYTFQSQLRLLNSQQPLAFWYVDGGLGYTINPKHLLWAGYLWGKHEPNRRNFEEKRLWQEHKWIITDDANSQSHIRTRLEEMSFSNERSPLVILREALVNRFDRYRFGHIIPMAYEELFFRLNHPDYASHSFFSRNRLFLGVKIHLAHRASWEIGYLNQYDSEHARGPSAMTHILMATFKCGAPEIMYNISD